MRCDTIKKQDAEFRRALLATSRMEGNVVVTDLRSYATLPIGNRFLIYVLYPQANVSLRIHWGPKRETVIAAVGHSIFNRTCNTRVGELMSKYGGGGHRGAGTAPLPLATAEGDLEEILLTLQRNG
jgi:nanoRNase/pAp phosphatase (c-di-AMP/oligoRNAs hydrolase)